MLSHFNDQGKGIRSKDNDDLKHHFFGTLPFRYPIMDSRDLESQLDDSIATLMSFIQYKDKECHNSIDNNQYDNPDTKRKIDSFLKGLSYWFKYRHGFKHPNTERLCYCPCSKHYSTVMCNLCPHLSSDNLRQCDSGLMNLYDLKSYLIDIMEADNCDVFHSVIVVYIIKIFPLCTTLLESKISNDFFMHYFFSLITYIFMDSKRYIFYQVHE